MLNSNKKGVGSVILLVMFAIALLLLAFVIKKVPLSLLQGPANVDFFSSGPDLKCGNNDDRGTLTINELGCTSIDFKPKDACDSGLACSSEDSSPYFIVSGKQYSSQEGEIRCETPDKVLMLKDIPLIRPTERNIQQYPNEDLFLNRYNAYYDCGPFIIVNDKLYVYNDLREFSPRADIPFIVPSQSNAAHIELFATYCWNECPDCDKPNYSCHQIERTTAENIFQEEVIQGESRTQIELKEANETRIVRTKLIIDRESLTLLDIIKLFFARLFSFF